MVTTMPTFLKGKNLLDVGDLTKEQFIALLDLSSALKAEKKSGTERQRLTQKEIVLIFEKTSTRARDVSRARRLADRPQRIDEGHRTRAGPDVRRDRVPRLLAGSRRDARQIRRGSGLQRPDRRVPPNADARRCSDHARALDQTPRAGGIRLPRRRPEQHGALAARNRGHARHGRPDRRSPGTLAGRG